LLIDRCRSGGQWQHSSHFFTIATFHRDNPTKQPYTGDLKKVR
jgi:hypothetical protein